MWALVWLSLSLQTPVISLFTATEAQCRAYGEALHETGEVRGSWMCARLENPEVIGVRQWQPNAGSKDPVVVYRQSARVR